MKCQYSESDIAIQTIKTLLDGKAHITSEIYANEFNDALNQNEMTKRIRKVLEIWRKAGVVIAVPLIDIKSNISDQTQKFLDEKGGKSGDFYQLDEKIHDLFEKKRGIIEEYYEKHYPNEPLDEDLLERKIICNIERLHLLAKRLPVKHPDDKEYNFDEFESQLIPFTPSKRKLLDSFENINEIMPIFDIVSNFKSHELQKLKQLFEKISKNETIDEQTKYHELKSLKNEYHQLESAKLESLFGVYFLCWFSFYTNRE
jgi:hypothetical protein